ncbi:chemotaxis protein CheW [bacterium]|nr:chemotaxis protein CheW [bacterium]
MTEESKNSTIEKNNSMSKIIYMPDKKAVLKKRAEALAKEMADEWQDKDKFEVVEFILAYELYGIKSSFVQEVYPLKNFTPLPGTPPFLLGITNIRGRIVSIVDIKKLFNLPDSGITDLNRVIIIENGESELGILADRIMGIRNISDVDFKANLLVTSDTIGNYIHGITEDKLIVLDVDKIFGDKRLIINSEV